MGVSIALVEALFPAEAETPWLGRVGDSVVAAVFILGLAAEFGIGFKQNQFMASRTQLLTTAVLSMLLIVSAFLIPARKSRMACAAPSPWITGAIAFVMGVGILKTPPDWGWVAVCVLAAIDVAFLVFVRFFSRQNGWSALHILGLAAGGALGYGILAFTRKPLIGGLLWMRIGNAVFLAATICLIWLGATRLISYQTMRRPSSE